MNDSSDDIPRLSARLARGEPIDGDVGRDAIAALTELARASNEQDSAAAFRRASALLDQHLPSFRPLLEAITQRNSQMEWLVRLAGCDSLTGLGNRRAFEEALAREAARHERTGEPFALVLLDLDDLKEINDGKGHGAGDRALNELAEACTDAIRTTDTAARLGGDEFAILLPQANGSGAQALASRLRTAIQARSVDGVELRVSVGVSACEEGQQVSTARILERADQELYRDKDARKKRRAARSAA